MLDEYTRNGIAMIERLKRPNEGEIFASESAKRRKLYDSEAGIQRDHIPATESVIPPHSMSHITDQYFPEHTPDASYLRENWDRSDFAGNLSWGMEPLFKSPTHNQNFRRTPLQHQSQVDTLSQKITLASPLLICSIFASPLITTPKCRKEGLPQALSKY